MQAFNPYLPSYEYIPDVEPYVFDGRVYVYGSHDCFNGKDFCLNDYTCWSAPVDDLGNWRNEGVIYRRDQDPLNKGLKQYIYAPDVQKGPDGRYYLYYVLNRSTVVSVAVCDTPAGKYEFYGHVKNSDGTVYGTTPGDVNNFDPGVLVDEDGRVYLYVGFSPEKGFMRTVMGMRKRNLDGAFCMELEPDMLTMKTEPRMVAPGPENCAGSGFEGHPFYEASSMRKVNGKYYFIYSSTLSHELCYAVSDYPDKGFRFGGTIVSNGDIGLDGNKKPVNYTGNTHGSIVEIAGNWYVFYHRQTNLQKCARQGCAEKIEILPDGSILQVEMTSCGLNQKPLKGAGRYEARIACQLTSKEGTFPYTRTKEKNKKQLHPYFTQGGEDREADGDQYIANMRDGSMAGFKYFEFNVPDCISVEVRGTAEGILEVRTEPGGPAVAGIQLRPGQDWTVYQAKMSRLLGIHALYFVYCGTGYLDFYSFELTNK